MSDRTRVQGIRAFREELRRLCAEGVVTGDETLIAAISDRHEKIISAASEDYSIDFSREQERLSAGMRLATLLGAIALSIAWALFVSSVWDDMARAVRLSMVWIPPVLLWVTTEVAARRDKSGYVANIFATVGSIALAVAAVATDSIQEWDLPRLPFVLVGTYSMALAYRHKLVLPLVIGGAGLGAWLWSLSSLLADEKFDYAFQFAEPAIVLGFTAGVIGLVRKSDPVLFRSLWKLSGSVAIVWSLLILGVAGEASWFGPGNGVEAMYQVVAALALVAMVWVGLKHDEVIIARAGAVGLVLYLLFRLIDWFWNVIPDWLFFLLVGLLSIGVLIALRRLRLRERGAPQY